ncbi:MAG: alpha/beta hydrolase [Firmicutes bacterium]|nr:alpha/beta hydrolase [Bacillota bacterium]
MQIIFSHGKESGPWGTKIKRLADTAKRLGCDVESIDYSDTMDPDTRAARLQQVLQDKDLTNTVLMGSSMGGYVTLQACKQMPVQAAFILAPAIYMPGYEHQAPTQKIANLTLVHGWHDDIIPVEHSIRFAREQDCTLHLVNDDHRLIDSLDAIDAWFEVELQRLITAP